MQTVAFFVKLFPNDIKAPKNYPFTDIQDYDIIDKNKRMES